MEQCLGAGIEQVARNEGLPDAAATAPGRSHQNVRRWRYKRSASAMRLAGAGDGAALSAFVAAMSSNARPGDTVMMG